MASFYNRYYRYYKPYPPTLFGKPRLMNPIKPSSSLYDASSASCSSLLEQEVGSSRFQETFNETGFSSNLPEMENRNCSSSNLSGKAPLNGHFSEKQKKSQSDFSFGPLRFKNPIFTDVEDPIFEILGIQLYLDDIIILGLLFFLYQEGVQDEMLFIALIMLLLG